MDVEIPGKLIYMFSEHYSIMTSLATLSVALFVAITIIVGMTPDWQWQHNWELFVRSYETMVIQLFLNGPHCVNVTQLI